MPKSSGGVEGWCVERGGMEEEKGGGEEEKQVPQSYRAGASKDSEGGKEGRREGRRGRKTLVKLSTDA